MTALGVVLTVVVLVAIAVFILAFEKRRAQQIERDLREPGTTGHDAAPPPADDGLEN